MAYSPLSQAFSFILTCDYPALHASSVIVLTRSIAKSFIMFNIMMVNESLTNISFQSFP